GRGRIVLERFLEGFPYLVARYHAVKEEEEASTDLEARFLHLRQAAQEALSLLQGPSQLIEAVEGASSPGALADLVATFLDIKPEEKQEILETFNVRARLDRVSSVLAHRISVLRLSREIQSQTQGTLEKAQREMFLREQLRTIQKELGEDAGRGEEMEELERKVAEAHM